MPAKRYYPDYAPGFETPHAQIFSYIINATRAPASEADALEMVDACFRQLEPLMPAQIAFELIRLHEMLRCVRGQVLAELVMQRFLPRRPVRRQLLRQLREQQYDSLANSLKAAA